MFDFLVLACVAVLMAQFVTKIKKVTNTENIAFTIQKYPINDTYEHAGHNKYQGKYQATRLNEDFCFSIVP